MPPSDELSMVNAKRVCVIPVYQRPDILAACTTQIMTCARYREWAFLFSFDRGVDPRCKEIVDAFKGVKQVMRQPDHPYPGNFYNVVSAMRTATKLPAVEQILYLPEDYMVAFDFFAFHEVGWTRAAEDPEHGHKVQTVAALLGADASGVACRSWRAKAVADLIGEVPESFFLFSPTFFKKTWPTWKWKTTTVDQMFGKLGKSGIAPADRSRAYHMGFYTRPDSPAGLRWNREMDSQSIGRRAKRIAEMTDDDLNARRDGDIAPMKVVPLAKPAQRAAPPPPRPGVHREIYSIPANELESPAALAPTPVNENDPEVDLDEQAIREAESIKQSDLWDPSAPPADDS